MKRLAKNFYLQETRVQIYIVLTAMFSCTFLVNYLYFLLAHKIAFCPDFVALIVVESTDNKDVQTFLGTWQVSHSATSSLMLAEKKYKVCHNICIVVPFCVIICWLHLSQRSNNDVILTSF